MSVLLFQMCWITPNIGAGPVQHNDVGKTANRTVLAKSTRSASKPQTHSQTCSEKSQRASILA